MARPSHPGRQMCSAPPARSVSPGSEGTGLRVPTTCTWAGGRGIRGGAEPAAGWLRARPLRRPRPQHHLKGEAPRPARTRRRSLASSGEVRRREGHQKATASPASRVREGSCSSGQVAGGVAGGGEIHHPNVRQGPCNSLKSPQRLRQQPAGRSAGTCREPGGARAAGHTWAGAPPTGRRGRLHALAAPVPAEGWPGTPGCPQAARPLRARRTVTSTAGARPAQRTTLPGRPPGT